MHIYVRRGEVAKAEFKTRPASSRGQQSGATQAKTVRASSQSLAEQGRYSISPGIDIIDKDKC